MSGIPVYMQSPINAAKADGISPHTTTPAPTQTMPTTTVATTTDTPSSMASYPAARQGVSAMPVPTSAAQRYVPMQPTPTTKSAEEGPSAPQPGALPQPTSSVRSNLPPPPKAGERLRNPLQTMPQPYPPQMSIPPPTTAFGAQPPSSSTSTTTTSTAAFLVPLPSEGGEAPRRSLEHPPGYSQNPYASNMSADQRRAQDAHNSSDIGGYNADKTNSTAAFGVNPEDVWNTAKSWASTAGNKLAEVESEVWKRVNGEK